jgi:hypothetical protein
LLQEGGASIKEANKFGYTALLFSAANVNVPTLRWLLESGGASMADVNAEGASVWDLLECYLIDRSGLEYDAATVTALLRVMVVRGEPPGGFEDKLLPGDAIVLQEGALLRARLPAYIARRRAVLDQHCQLIAPLRALVHGYEEPTTTEELWATGLGAAIELVHEPIIWPRRKPYPKLTEK